MEMGSKRMGVDKKWKRKGKGRGRKKRTAFMTDTSEGI